MVGYETLPTSIFEPVILPSEPIFPLLIFPLHNITGLILRFLAPFHAVQPEENPQLLIPNAGRRSEPAEHLDSFAFWDLGVGWFGWTGCRQIEIFFVAFCPGFIFGVLIWNVLIWNHFSFFDHFRNQIFLAAELVRIGVYWFSKILTRPDFWGWVHLSAIPIIPADILLPPELFLLIFEFRLEFWVLFLGQTSTLIFLSLRSFWLFEFFLLRELLVVPFERLWCLGGDPISNSGGEGRVGETGGGLLMCGILGQGQLPWKRGLAVGVVGKLFFSFLLHRRFGWCVVWICIWLANTLYYI